MDGGLTKPPAGRQGELPFGQPPTRWGWRVAVDVEEEVAGAMLVERNRAGDEAAVVIEWLGLPEPGETRLRGALGEAWAETYSRAVRGEGGDPWSCVVWLLEMMCHGDHPRWIRHEGGRPLPTATHLTLPMVLADLA